jgi:transposase-like protein
VLLVLSDDLSGLTEAVAALFEKAWHQLCVVHLKRNAVRHMSRQDASEFHRRFDLVLKISADFISARKELEKLCDEYAARYPGFIGHVRPKADHYVHVVRFDDGARRYLCTTNLVEGLNNKAELACSRAGGYFRDEQHLRIVTGVAAHQIKNKWIRRSHPRLAPYAAHLRQLFNGLYAGD